jgi:hypothetical protein
MAKKTMTEEKEIDLNKIRRLRSVQEVRLAQTQLLGLKPDDSRRAEIEIQLLRGVRKTNMQKSNKSKNKAQKIARRANRGAKGRSQKR